MVLIYSNQIHRCSCTCVYVVYVSMFRKWLHIKNSSKMTNSETVKTIELVYAPNIEISINTHQSPIEKAEVLSNFILKTSNNFQDIADFLSVLSLNIVKELNERSKNLKGFPIKNDYIVILIRCTQKTANIN